MTTASDYGYSISFFNQSPELQGLLSQATSENWTPDRFVAAFRNTSWFQQNSESARKYAALKTGDPSTLNQLLSASSEHITSLGDEMGATLNRNDALAIADMALRYGWNDDNIKNALADRLTITGGGYWGQAGVLQGQLKQMVAQYGIDVSDNLMGDWIRSGALGRSNADSIKAQIVQMAASKYPPFAERLNAGETMMQIADPYIQAQAKLLEVNPEAISLKDDPLIQNALVTRDKDGRPFTKTVWEFQNDVRKDPRWAKTQNAQDSGMQTANKVLQQFGLVSS